MDKALSTTNRTDPLRIFLQINTSNEDAKSGMAPGACLEVAQHVRDTCPRLQLSGLMTIGSVEHSHAAVGDTQERQPLNPDFRVLLECRQRLEQAGGFGRLELSMGMSSDYDVAMRMGSTNVRVGSTIFGARGG